MKIFSFFFLVVFGFASSVYTQVLSAQLGDKGNVSCHGMEDGYAIIDASGGKGPYSYELNFSGVYQSGRTFSQLGPGNHTVRVMDATFDFVDVAFTISEPLPLQSGVANQQNVDCYGEQTGEVNLIAFGGTGAHEFAINTNAFTSSPNFKFLPAGGHSFRLKDENQCSADTFLFIAATPPIETFVKNKKDVNCFGEQNGSFELESVGGHGGYSYSLDGLQFFTESNFLDLPEGSYNVFIQDSLSCQSYISVHINQPDALEQEIQKEDVHCFGEREGELSISAIGGSPPYTYSIDGTNFSFSNQYSALGAQVFQIKVRDNHGCETELEEIEIIQPEPLEIELSATDIDCKGENSGSAEVGIEGGIEPYSIQWNDNGSLDMALIEGLGPGNYFVEVTDANGCVKNSFVEVEEPENEIMLQEQLLQASSCGMDNGVLELAVQDGVAPVSFEWEGYPNLDGHIGSSLAPGTYKVKVTDALGCTASLISEVPGISEVKAGFQTSPQLNSEIVARQGKIHFFNTSVGATRFQWDFGDGAGASSEASPSYTYEHEGEYEIQLIASNTLSCADTFMKKVTVVPDELMELADAFSPNGDGINDIFRIVGSGLQQADMVVVDRWGRSIQAVNLLADGWDGRDRKGDWVSPGTYAYKLKVVFRSGYIIERAGKLSVLR